MFVWIAGCGLSPGEVVVAVFSTAAQNLALSTLQEGIAKLCLLGWGSLVHFNAFLGVDLAKTS